MAYIFANTQIPQHTLTKAFLCVLIFVISGICLGQQPIDKKAVKLVSKAEEAIKERKFEVGEDLLLEAIGRDSSYATAYVKLFGLFRMLRQSSKTHQFQLLYVRNVPEKELNPRIWQSLASYEFAIGSYRSAQDYLAKTKKKDSVLNNSITFAIEQLENPDSLKISELPTEVNRFGYQYLPVLTVDSRTLIFTAREDNQSDENIVVSTLENENWTDALPISENITTPYNEGACTISADGRTLIFTSCEGREGFGNCDLFFSKKTGKIWSVPANLGKNVNSRFWDSQPSLSADGKTLYFVSNRPGGVGGKDIWVSSFENSEWVTPKNIGKFVNTKRDETTPFIHSNNHALFFSSNGHIGMGGFDLIKTEKLDDEWRHVENLGYPINTFHDEVSLFITSDGGHAYFAKEEKHLGVIKSSKLVSYPIPSEDALVSAVSYLTGRVRDAKTKEPLKATLELVDLSDLSHLFSTESDPISGEYFIVIPPGMDFGAFIEKEGYLFEDVSLVSQVEKMPDTIDIYLNPLEIGAKIVLENIYFGFDSDEMNPKSNEELNRLVKLLKKYPTIEIEISGHTDDVGSFEYNQNLSEKRAKKVYDFLVKKNIQKSVITHTGYAHTKPQASNDSEQGRAKNRRIEIKIVRI